VESAVQSENTAQSVPVWRPPAGRPAAHDWAVTLRLNAYYKVRGSLIKAVAFLVVLAVIEFVLPNLTLLLPLFMVAVAALVLGQLVVFQVSYGRWLTVIRALTDNAVPTRVKAEIVSRKRATIVLAVDSGRTHLRLVNISRGARQVIGRTGEIAVAGPDADGMAAIFVDGLPFPIPGQVVEAPPRTALEPVDPSGNAVTMWFAKRYARLQWLPIGFFALMFASLVAVVAQNSGDTYLYVSAIYLVLLGFLAYKFVDVYRMPSLLKRGDWQAYPVVIQVWKGNPRIVGGLGMSLSLPDGTQLPVSVRWASADLVANIQASNQLWVTSRPEAGERTVVGVPGFPIAAPARFVMDKRVYGRK
jgi:hypothetical protein